MPLSYTIPSVDTIQEYYRLEYDFNAMSNTSWDYNLCITWDYEEETIDKIMINEVYTDPSIKANWLWLEEIKKMCDYKLGNEIWIFTKSNGDGYFDCFFNKKNTKKNCYYDLHIDKEGYCSYNMISYNQAYWVRCHSIYNDNISDYWYNKNKNNINSDSDSDSDSDTLF